MTNNPGLKTHLPHWYESSGSSLLVDIYKAVRLSLGDFGGSPFMSAYRKRSGIVIDSLLDSTCPWLPIGGFDHERTRQFLSLLDVSFSETSSVAAFREMVKLLKILFECRLVSVRFAAVLIGICVVVILHRSGCFVSESHELTSAICSRRKDTCDLIRRLATTDGICRLSSMSAQGLISEETHSLALQEFLKDPSRTNRLEGLSLIQKRLKSGCSFFRRCIATVGPVVANRCFDVDSAVASAAIELLSCSVSGELLLGSSESDYQRISNLIWRQESAWKPGWKAKRGKAGLDPLQTSRAVVKFIDVHIMASPGILSTHGSPEKMLAMVLEFVDQYSDGFVAQLNGQLIASIFSTFKLNARSNFLKIPESYLIIVHESRGSIESSISSQIQRMEAFLKLNTLLEIMLSVIRLLTDHELSEFITGGVGQALIDVTNLFNEANALFPSSNRRKFDVIALEIAEDVEARKTERNSIPCSTDARLSQAISDLNANRQSLEELQTFNHT